MISIARNIAVTLLTTLVITGAVSSATEEPAKTKRSIVIDFTTTQTSYSNS